MDDNFVYELLYLEYKDLNLHEDWELAYPEGKQEVCTSLL